LENNQRVWRKGWRKGRKKEEKRKKRFGENITIDSYKSLTKISKTLFNTILNLKHTILLLFGEENH